MAEEAPKSKRPKGRYFLSDGVPGKFTQPVFRVILRAVRTPPGVIGQYVTVGTGYNYISLST